MNKEKYRILPFPHDKDFAFTFVDDTDYSTVFNTKPVYEFLYKHQIFGTKTIWTKPQKRTSSYRVDLERETDPNCFSGSTIQDAEYKKFILNLHDKGYEIALHGVSAGNTKRNEIINGLNEFHDLIGHDPVINIFHAQNIENLYAGSAKLESRLFRFLEKLTDSSDYQGHIEGSPYFWGDIAKQKIKYMRLPFHTIDEINTYKINPSMPFFDDERKYVNFWFTNSDGSDVSRFNRLTQNNNIQQLEWENGICIIYTHFAKGFARQNRGNLILDECFKKRIENISSYNNAWFPTTSVLLDSILACRKLSIKHIGNMFIITNCSDAPSPPFRVKMNKSTQLSQNGIIKYSASKNGLINIDGLPGASSITYECNEEGNYQSRENMTNDISRQERIKIELYNYLGLVRQKLKIYN